MPTWRQRCVACGATTQEGAWLCPAHAEIIDGKYTAENPHTLKAYVTAGIAEIEASHVSHVLFDQYLHDQEEQMPDKCKCVKSVTYKTDDGRDAFAFVLKEDGDKYDLAVLDPDTYALHAANDVPVDSPRVS